MCEATVYILKSDKEETVVEGVDFLENYPDHVKITDVFGEEKVIRARVKRFSLLNHKIVLEPF